MSYESITPEEIKIAKETFVHLPHSVSSYHQLLCSRCSQPTESRGFHYKCKDCGSGFHTSIWKTGGGYCKFSPQLCPVCSVNTKKCFSCTENDIDIDEYQYNYESSCRVCFPEGEPKALGPKSARK